MEIYGALILIPVGALLIAGIGIAVDKIQGRRH